MARRRSLVAATIGTLTFLASVHGNDENPVLFDENAPPTECISLANLKETRVLDERHIMFEMVGGRRFINTLPRRCAHLATRRHFAYDGSRGRLCAVDSIISAPRFSTPAVTQPARLIMPTGVRCGLGQFFPLAAE